MSWIVLTTDCCEVPHKKRAAADGLLMGSCRLGLVMVDDGKDASNLYSDVQVCVPKVDDIQLSI